MRIWFYGFPAFELGWEGRGADVGGDSVFGSADGCELNALFVFRCFGVWLHRGEVEGEVLSLD